MRQEVTYLAVYEGNTTAFSQLSQLNRHIETMDVLGEDVVLYDTDENIYELAVKRGRFFEPDFVQIKAIRKATAPELEHLTRELQAYLIFLGEDLVDAHISILAKALKAIQGTT